MHIQTSTNSSSTYLLSTTSRIHNISNINPPSIFHTLATVSTRHYPQGQFWLWVVGFLAVSVSSEQAAYPRLVSLALAMQFGAKAVNILFQVILGSILRWIKYLSSDLILRISSVQYNNYLLIYLISSLYLYCFRLQHSMALLRSLTTTAGPRSRTC